MSRFGSASGFDVVGIRVVRLCSALWFGVVVLGVVVWIGVKVRCQAERWGTALVQHQALRWGLAWSEVWVWRHQAWSWGMARHWGAAAGLVSGFGSELLLSVRVRLGVGVCYLAWRRGSALRFSLALWFVVGVWLGVRVWCLWGRSGFGGFVLLSMSLWGNSGLTTRLSWDGLEVFVLF